MPKESTEPQMFRDKWRQHIEKVAQSPEQYLPEADFDFTHDSVGALVIGTTNKKVQMVLDVGESCVKLRDQDGVVDALSVVALDPGPKFPQSGPQLASVTIARSIRLAGHNKLTLDARYWGYVTGSQDLSSVGLGFSHDLARVELKEPFRDFVKDGFGRNFPPHDSQFSHLSNIAFVVKKITDSGWRGSQSLDAGVEYSIKPREAKRKVRRREMLLEKLPIKDLTPEAVFKIMRDHLDASLRSE